MEEVSDVIIYEVSDFIMEEVSEYYKRLVTS